MAAMSSCHHHPSSIAISRFGTRKTTMRFSAPENSNAHLSQTATSLKMNTQESRVSSVIRKKSTNQQPVLEDQVRGVVCYRDDKGEVICEGYDEGPRLGMRLPEKACFPWPVGIQITDFIDLSTVGVFEDGIDGLQRNDQKRQF